MSIVSSRGLDQFPIRLPDGVRDEIKREAKANGRSMNAEIVSRIISPPAMTLRDWFATHASEADIDEHRKLSIADDGQMEWGRSREAARYAYADAMIEVRKP